MNNPNTITYDPITRIIYPVDLVGSSSCMTASYAITASHALNSGGTSTQDSCSWASGSLSASYAPSNSGSVFINCYPDGTFVYNGVSYKPVSSTCGIQEAINMLPMAPNLTSVGGGTLNLAPGIFYTSRSIYTPTTRNPFHLSIIGSGMLAGGIVYTGSLVEPVLSIGTGSFNQNKTFTMHNLILASAYNVTTSLLEFNSYTYTTGSVATADISFCWFGDWNAMKLNYDEWSHQYVLTPSLYAVRTKHNLVGIEAKCPWADNIVITNCHFDYLAAGAIMQSDHFELNENTFYGCGVQDTGSDWPANSLRGIGGSIIITDEVWPGCVLHHQLFRGNTFLGNMSSPHYLLKTNRELSLTSYEDSFETDAAMIALTGSVSQSLNQHVSWTFINPKLYWNTTTYVDLGKYILPPNPTTASWNSIPATSEHVRIWDMRDRNYYDGNFSFTSGTVKIETQLTASQIYSNTRGTGLTLDGTLAPKMQILSASALVGSFGTVTSAGTQYFTDTLDGDIVGKNEIGKAILFGSGPGASALTITGSGKVGVGVRAPVNSLDVKGNISCSAITASRFFGTADTASYITASNIVGTVISASYTETASYAKNGGTGTQASCSWASSSLSASYASIAKTLIEGALITSSILYSPTIISDSEFFGSSPVLSIDENRVSTNGLWNFNSNVSVGASNVVLHTDGNINATAITASLDGTASYASYASTANNANLLGNALKVNSTGDITELQIVGLDNSKYKWNELAEQWEIDSPVMFASEIGIWDSANEEYINIVTGDSVVHIMSNLEVGNGGQPALNITAPDVYNAIQVNTNKFIVTPSGSVTASDGRITLAKDGDNSVLTLGRDGDTSGKIVLHDAINNVNNQYITAGDGETAINTPQLTVNGILYANGDATVTGNLNVSNGITGSLQGTATSANDMAFGAAKNQIHIVERFLGNTGGALSGRLICQNVWNVTSNGTAGSNAVATDTAPRMSAITLTTGAGYTSSYAFSFGNVLTYTQMPIMYSQFAFQVPNTQSLSSSFAVGICDYSLGRNATYISRLAAYGPDGIYVGSGVYNTSSNFMFSVFSNDAGTGIRVTSSKPLDLNWHLCTIRRNGDNAYFSLDGEPEITVAGATAGTGMAYSGPQVIITTSGSWASSIKCAYIEFMAPLTQSWY